MGHCRPDPIPFGGGTYGFTTVLCQKYKTNTEQLIRSEPWLVPANYSAGLSHLLSVKYFDSAERYCSSNLTNNDVKRLQTLGVLLRSFPFSLLTSPLIQLGGLGSAATPPQRVQPELGHRTHFGAFWGKKNKAFLGSLLMSCIVSAASFCIAIDLFYDGTNHTINYVDENSALFAWLCSSYWGPTHWWTPAGQILGVLIP